jgi:SAM-dependent methyltransferase
MIYTDPPHTFIDQVLEDRSSPNPLVQTVITSPEDVLSFAVNDQVAKPGEWKGMFRATGNDPWIDIPVSFEADTIRYCVVAMVCKTASGNARAQIYWTGDRRPGYSEDLSATIPLISDGQNRTYLIDLHEGSRCGSINFRWRHRGSISRIRFDPLDTPGEFLVRQMCFLHEDYFRSEPLRQEVGLTPARRELSFRYMNGWGVELGALENPLPVPPTSYVQYSDRLSLEEARREYPELSEWPLVNPTIICDATALTISDGSLDFLIANHVLEHMKDPLGAIREWLRVLRDGGHLYIAVPEHTNPLDKHRKVTPIEHMVADFENRRARAAEDLAHFPEWVGSVNFGLPTAEQTRIVEELVARNYAIHFHTFTKETFTALLEEATRRFGGEMLECRISVHPELVECIAILRKGRDHDRGGVTISPRRASEKLRNVLASARRRVLQEIKPQFASDQHR